MKRFALFLVALCLTLPVWGQSTIAFVNAANKAGGTTGTNGNVITATATNTVLVFVTFYNNQLNTPHVTSVTDSQSNTYSQLGIIEPNNSLCNGTGGTTFCPFMEVWYTLSLASTGSDTITVASTPTGAGTAPAIEFLQYSGVTAVNLSNVSMGSALSASSSTLTITTSYNNDWIVMSSGVNPTSSTQSVNGCNARGTATGNNSNTISIKSCDSGAVTTAGTATSIGMTFAGGTAWAGGAVELCTTSPCPAGGVKNNVVIIN